MEPQVAAPPPATPERLIEALGAAALLIECAMAALKNGQAERAQDYLRLAHQRALSPSAATQLPTEAA